jgi:spore maturation protein CgeB
VAEGLDIAVFGSSIVSSWWNGAATYYRGLARGLAGLGDRVTFYEPIAYARQEHRDIADPDWCTVVVYRAESVDDVRSTVARAAGADVVIKTSGVGVHDDTLEDEVAQLGRAGVTTAFLDVDAPATLARVEADPSDPFRALVGCTTS